MIFSNSLLLNILSNDKHSFKTIFEQKWKEHLSKIPTRYSNARQLVIGNRLRPFLICWGYVLSGKKLNYKVNLSIAEFAIYIELLHKGTLLVDDLIDGDKTRHGEPSFHIEFSDSEAIILAVYLIGDSIEKIYDTIPADFRVEEVLSIYKAQGALLKHLSKGVLDELTMENAEFASIKTIRDMILLQTSSIISNGLVSGYRFGRGDLNEIPTIDSIGKDLGYIFQVLNDLEPYSSPSKSLEHKGNINYDTNKHRKNIVTSFVKNRANLNGDNVKPLELINYFRSNDVIMDIRANLELVCENLNDLLGRFPKSSTTIQFQAFLDHILEVSLMRINRKDQTILSDIFKR